MIKITDSLGCLVTTFKDKDYKAAYEYIFIHPGYSISKETKSSTERQRTAIKFIERRISVSFLGDINNFENCSKFISKFLPLAIQVQYEDSIYNESR